MKDSILWNKLSIALEGFSVYENFLDTGKVISVSDGVAKVSGLLGVKAGERVKLGKQMIDGLALSLEGNIVGIVIFGNFWEKLELIHTQLWADWKCCSFGLDYEYESRLRSFEKNNASIRFEKSKSVTLRAAVTR